jgi:OPA family glycerol-3-phosphate transporter-like MFS transporter
LKGAPPAEKSERPDEGPFRTPGAPPEAPKKAPREPFREVLPWLAKKPSFWIAITLSFLLTFVRTGFMTWTPVYITSIATAAKSASPISGSIAKSALFSVAGMLAAPTIGRISDKLGPGKRAPAMVASLLILVGAVLALAHAPIKDPWVAAIAIALCGLFLLGPYSMLAGVMALDVAGKRGTSTATGIIDGVGYLGGSLAGILLGSIAERASWSAAFDVVAIAAFLATLVSAGSIFIARRTAATSE